ncbi:hybrid sensor histidine kinase/response regulator [Haloarchaeobius litoreus]|uniref:histidine kinase n=1 Tax=Haloarchaeobius litoreus TaxID=755306 RepID=A0ABD6DDG9_9EURY|nr:response regulator [Haloarchaeobius litoreus]
MTDAIRVLHVDDEPAFLTLTSEFLARELEAVEVETTTSAADALDRLDAFDPDCVVSDYQMPEMDGLELLEAVRERREELPFILFTGHGSEQIASNAISAGVTDYLQKGSANEQFQLLANRVRNAVEAYRTQEAFEESERMFSTLISNLPGMVYRCRNAPEWPMEFVSQGCLDLTGYQPSQLERGDVVWGDEVLHPEDQEMAWGVVQNAIEDEESFEVTYRIRRRDGAVRWMWEQGRGVYDEDGALLALEGFITDVTERVRYEQRLDALNEVLGKLLETSDRHECAWVAVEAASDSLEFPIASVRLYDGETDELEPVAVTDATAADLEERLAFPGENGPAWDAYTTGEVQWYPDIAPESVTIESHADIRSLLVLPLGRYGALVLASPTPDDFAETDHNLARILAANLQSALDRADRERAVRERERELRDQNARLEEFTNIVSHDLRNPLAVVRGRLDLARETGSDEHFDRAEASLTRIEDLVSDMLTLAKQGMVVGETEALYLEVVARRAWEAVETDGAGLTVASDLPLVADQGRLQQLLENLFANAVEHGSTGRSAAITVGELDDASGFYVADDGPGIPDEQRAQVFEPGFSTDEQGTGFGLAIVQQIARAHGWSVAATEADDGGARFEFTDVELVE